MGRSRLFPRRRLTARGARPAAGRPASNGGPDGESLLDEQRPLVPIARGAGRVRAAAQVGGRGRRLSSLIVRLVRKSPGTSPSRRNTMSSARKAPPLGAPGRAPALFWPAPPLAPRRRARLRPRGSAGRGPPCTANRRPALEAARPARSSANGCEISQPSSVGVGGRAQDRGRRGRGATPGRAQWAQSLVGRVVVEDRPERGCP